MIAECTCLQDGGCSVLVGVTGKHVEDLKKVVGFER